MPFYRQGDNLPAVKTGIVSSGVDLTEFVGKARMTASTPGVIVGAALAADLAIKVDDGTSNLLYSAYFPAEGIRAIVFRTKEWIKITAINGSNLTIVRAQPDPGGTASVAADVRAGDTIYLVPLDTAPISAQLDPDVLNNEGAILEFAPDQTRIPVGSYEFVVTFENSSGDKRITWKADEPLTIEADRNRFGV